ncbi:MAG TPA: CopD family protein [Hyphomicrobiaceae bacterium]|nr:CopD family protein [Hyphomicrobiaceae bacterium]
MTAWLKAIHISSLAIWCAGLVVLPSLFAQRRSAKTLQALYRLQRFTRSLFIKVTSPAAFVAIGTGTALIFARNIFTAWMLLKLSVVGVLVIIHVWSGHIIVHLFGPNGRYSRLRQVTVTFLTLCVVAAILALVLAKPVLELSPVTDWLRPGGLQSLLESIRPTP